ncbi:MAG: hypothetical protein HFJ59_05340 [Clostridia bacterium]|nr:hypothetical protein [Clostridia bacterium]
MNNIQAILPIALPEVLGIIDNVWVHITLSNKILSLKVESYPEQRYYSTTGLEWPTIFNEDTKETVQLKVNENDEFNTSVFGIIYTCYDETFLKGSFTVTFNAWKDESLRSYYTETKLFEIDAEEFDTEF